VADNYPTEIGYLDSQPVVEKKYSKRIWVENTSNCVLSKKRNATHNYEAAHRIVRVNIFELHNMKIKRFNKSFIFLN
jgi:hypothetical protein